MSVLNIDTDQTALFWDQVTSLDGVPYLLTFRYNTRESVYYLQIASADGSTVYAQGIKLVANYPLLRQFGDVPPGELIVMSTTPDDSPPALGELGVGARCILVYMEAADVYAGNPGEGWRNPNG